MTGHRAEMRPRYGRIATLGGSVAVVLIAGLGGLGALPSAAEQQGDARSAVEPAPTPARSGEPEPSKAPEPPTAANAPESAVRPPETGSDDLELIAPGADAAIDEALPPRSGQGRRVVFSEERQRVWLVAEDGAVERSYLVSGSVYDNLDPGTYEVYSRSENAIGIDDSGTMNWFVRFTQGPSGAAIGFHDIPVDDGEPVQSKEQLGTPLSHGCIRQKTGDAKAMWAFAPIGTRVVVTA